MSHYILTGATGLLGSYLLRDLLRQGHEVTVITRPTRLFSAEERICRLLETWETRSGPLPTPRVFSGNINEPHLGLDRFARDEIAGCCDGIIHSAASLKFREADGEPWRSNVTGTDHTLRFAEECQLREFHYISTAYVCGRTDTVAYELPVSSTVDPRNVYEASKCQAERLVLEADLPQPPTILRPSIIMGDAETGYTSTFHGVYLPLRQAVALIVGGLGGGSLDLAAGPKLMLNPRRILQLMGLTGSERKNLVPVDWVSRMILRVIGSPEHHGNIYHLINPAPASVELLTQMTVECVLESLGIDPRSFLAEEESPSELDEVFCKLLTVYREYWSDDPCFDSTGLSVIAADDPCPVVTADMLKRTFHFAIDEMVQRPAELVD